MLYTSDTKAGGNHKAAHAKPKWDNSAGPGAKPPASTTLLLCALAHGGLVIGIIWLIVYMFTRS